MKRIIEKAKASRNRKNKKKINRINGNERKEETDRERADKQVRYELNYRNPL